MAWPHLQTTLRKARFGFTVVELLVVLAAIGLLLSIVAPRYMHHLDAAAEVALKQNLFQMRDAIDKFHADQGRYPDKLQELVEKRYLRAVPVDPITRKSDSWVAVSPESGSASREGERGQVFDVKSGAPGRAADGTAYASW